MPPLLTACDYIPWDWNYRLRNWEHCRLKAEELYLKGKSKEAEVMYVQTLEQARLIGSSSYYYGISLLCLAEFYRSQKEYERTQPILKDALVVLLSRQGVSSEVNNKLLLQDIAKTETFLADTYLFEKNYAQAEKLYQKAITTVSPWLTDKANVYADNMVGQMVALDLHKIALICEKTARAKESSQYYERSLAVARNCHLLNKFRSRIVSDYRNMLIATGQKEKADVLDADKNWLYYSTMAEQYLDLHDWSQAQVWAEKSLAEIEKGKPEPQHVLITFNALSRVYFFKRRYAEAEKYCLLELDLAQKMRNDDLPASGKQPLRDPQAGTTASDIEASSRELSDLRIARCHLRLTDIWQKTGQNKKAREEGKKTCELMLHLGRAQRYSIRNVDELGALLIALHDYDTAKYLLRETISKFPQAPGSANLRTLLDSAIAEGKKAQLRGLVK